VKVVLQISSQAVIAADRLELHNRGMATNPEVPMRNESEPLVRWIGRPPMHAEAYSKATVVLLNRQIVFLDRLSADIRAANGAVVKRAEIIRALIDALAESGEDVRDVRTEADLKRRFLAVRRASADGRANG
jgi:hypothetical protein